MSDSPPTKHCYKCDKTKPSTSFAKQKRSKDGLQSQCKACNADYRAAHADDIAKYQRAYRVSNAPKLRQQSRLYHIAHVDKLREYGHAYRIANADKIHERNHRYRANNKDKRNESARRLYAADVEKARAAQRRTRAANPDVHRAARHRRRARIKENGGNVTAKELAVKRASQNGLCAYCQMPHDPQDLTIDHVIPIRHGGPHVISNIVFACGVCNSSKQDRTPEEWTDRWYERK